MKIAVLWSSSNLGGQTAAAKERVIAGLRSAGADVDEIHLNRLKLDHCRACGNSWGICRSEGKCIIRDDFEWVYSRLVAADGIVLVSAVYWHDITECMKAFLDRLRRCETFHNKFLAGKQCLLVASAGGTGRGAIKCLYNLEETLKHMEMGAFDRLPIIRHNKEYMLPALEQAGSAFANRIARTLEPKE